MLRKINIDQPCSTMYIIINEENVTIFLTFVFKMINTVKHFNTLEENM